MPSSLWLYSDPSLVYRILQNLLSNALKYTERGKVLIGVRRRGNRAEVQVLDTGPGITDDDRVRIFEEFERLNSGVDREEGLGLGLAIVKRYADLLDLPLHLRSSPGEGTLFSISVPVGKAQAITAGSPSTSAGDLAGLHLICLDNDPLVLDGMAQFLVSSGARVSTAHNRAELGAQTAVDADVLLVDYHLDGGDTGVVAAAVDYL